MNRLGQLGHSSARFCFTEPLWKQPAQTEAEHEYQTPEVSSASSEHTSHWEDDMPDYVEANADIRGKYRYSLMRKLATGEGTVLFVGLNPSTATAKEDDHTVRRCVRFAQAWGRERLYIGNLNAWRATDPKALPADAATAVGPCNREVLEQLVKRADLIIAAWGRHRLNSEAATLAEWLRSLPKTHCLRLNKTGTPTHPRCAPKAAVPIKLPRTS